MLFWLGRNVTRDSRKRSISMQQIMQASAAACVAGICSASGVSATDLVRKFRNRSHKTQLASNLLRGVPGSETQRFSRLSLPEIKSGRTGDAILPGAAWQ